MAQLFELAITLQPQRLTSQRRVRRVCMTTRRVSLPQIGLQNQSLTMQQSETRLPKLQNGIGSQATSCDLLQVCTA